MDKDTAWELFYKTGNLDAYLIYKQAKEKKEEKPYNALQQDREKIVL